MSHRKPSSAVEILLISLTLVHKLLRDLNQAHIGDRRSEKGAQASNDLIVEHHPALPSIGTESLHYIKFPSPPFKSMGCDANYRRLTNV
jgi:hypothetical protein